MKSTLPKTLLLSAAALALPALADRLTRRLAAVGYSRVAGEDPPRNPAVIGVSWSQALVWTALAGALGGVARMASRKALSNHGLPAET